MASFFATKDYDGNHIAMEAYIEAFDTRADAEAWLRDGLDPTEWKIEITEGRFGDAWVKCINDPRSDRSTLNYEPFTLDQLDIQGPGQHPGGRFWWVTPNVDVLVTKLTPVEDDSQA